MKVFADTKAVRRFGELYESLSEDARKQLSQKVRDLAKQKMEGDGEEFYITSQDLNLIYKSLSRRLYPQEIH